MIHPGEKVLNELKALYQEAPNEIKFFFADIVNLLMTAEDSDKMGGLFMTTLPMFGILSDNEIIKDSMITPLVGNKVKENVEYSFGIDPFGYTLRLGAEYFDFNEKKIASDKYIKLPSLSSLIVSTNERVKLPNSTTGILWGKSSYIRKGLIFTFGVVDAGYEGTLSFLVFNSSPKEILLNINEGICQIVFFRSPDVPSKSYEGKYNQSNGVTI